MPFSTVEEPYPECLIEILTLWYQSAETLEYCSPPPIWNNKLDCSVAMLRFLLSFWTAGVYCLSYPLATALLVNFEFLRLLPVVKHANLCQRLPRISSRAEPASHVLLYQKVSSQRLLLLPCLFPFFLIRYEVFEHATQKHLFVLPVHSLL